MHGSATYATQDGWEGKICMWCAHFYFSLNITSNEWKRAYQSDNSNDKKVLIMLIANNGVRDGWLPIQDIVNFIIIHQSLHKG